MVSFKATSSDVLIERIDDKKVTVHYNLPVPSEGGKRQPVVVLPIGTPSGAEGIRTPDLLRAREAPALKIHKVVNFWYSL